MQEAPRNRIRCILPFYPTKGWFYNSNARRLPAGLWSSSYSPLEYPQTWAHTSCHDQSMYSLPTPHGVPYLLFEYLVELSKFLVWAPVMVVGLWRTWCYLSWSFRVGVRRVLVLCRCWERRMMWRSGLPPLLMMWDFLKERIGIRTLWHHYQLINIPTAGAQAFLMNYT
jgi:hypothetical protein